MRFTDPGGMILLLSVLWLYKFLSIRGFLPGCWDAARGGDCVLVTLRLNVTVIEAGCLNSECVQLVAGIGSKLN